MTINDPADLLEQAADALESGRVGWMRGDIGFRTPGSDRGHEAMACAIGTLRHVAFGSPRMAGLVSPLAAEFRAYLSLEDRAISAMGFPGGTSELASWNDSEANQKEDVIDLMKHAAKDLRNKRKAA